MSGLELEGSKMLQDSKGVLDQKYRDWCLQNPTKFKRDGDLIVTSKDDIRDILLGYINDFHETSPDLFEDLLNSEDINEKSDGASVLLREKGNGMYQSKQFKAATDCYNKAISFAVEKSTLALAYANRSAVLFQKNQFKACYRDIERALKCGYPSNLAHKLVDRKAKCQMKLGSFSDAIVTFGEAMTAARKNVTDEKKLAPFIADVQKCLKVCSSKKASSLKLEDVLKEDSRMPMLTGVNPQMPAFTKAVQIEYAPKKGRYGVAARTIGCGEVILIEQSGLTFVNFDKRGEVCSHCLSSSDDLIPSPLNSKDMFCTNTCLQNAMNSYHQLESKLLTCLEKCELVQTEWFIALRAVLAKTLKYFLQNRKEFFAKRDDEKFAVDLKNDEKFLSDYSSVFAQQTHETSWKVQHLHLKAYTAYFFLQCLRKVDYLKPSNNKEELNRDEIFMGEVLMHLMNAASTNSLETLAYDVSQATLLEGKHVPVGGSFEPAFALLNHSCDPNTIRINLNGHTILLTNRTIAEGEEINVSYTSSCSEADKETRQNYLRRKYCFDCQCIACNQDWPISSKLPRNFDDLRPGQLLIDMDNTRLLMQQVSKIQKLGSSISQEQKAGNNKKAFGLCIEFVKTLEETIKRPHSYYLMAEVSMMRLAWILHGSYLQ